MSPEDKVASGMVIRSSKAGTEERQLYACCAGASDENQAEADSESEGAPRYRRIYGPWGQALAEHRRRDFVIRHLACLFRADRD